MQGEDAPRYSGMTDAFKKIWAAEGVKGRCCWCVHVLFFLKVHLFVCGCTWLCDMRVRACVHVCVFSVSLFLTSLFDTLGFYRGLVPNYAKVVPAISVSFYIYEELKIYFGVHSKH